MKKIVGILVLLAVVGGFGAYKLYNKPHKNVAETEAAFTLSASEIFAAFSMENADKYLDQIVAVSGTIYSLDMSNESEPQIVLQTTNDQGFVRAGFAPESLESIQALSEGSDVKLKGLCVGFNSPEGLDLLSEEEVVLSRCTLIE